MNEPDHIDQALAALPAPPSDPAMTERVRLTARAALLPGGQARRRALGDAFYVAEPWLAGAMVVVMLGWACDRVAVVFG